MITPIPKFAVVVLAGGKGERAGAPKGLVSVAGEPWLNHQQRVLATVTPLPPIVVVGVHAEAYSKHYAGSSQWVFLKNPAPERGPFSSLKLGISEALARYPHIDGVFILPVDTPAPITALWNNLASKISHGASAAIPTRSAAAMSGWNTLPRRPSRSGHPVCLSAQLCQDILKMDENDSKSRLDFVLATLHESQKKYIETTDSRAFLNLNARFDWDLTAPITIPHPTEPVCEVPRQRAAVACLSPNGLLVISGREPLSQKSFYFPPGGAIEAGESAAQAAQREVFEETGYCVDIDPSSEILSYQLTPWNGVLYASITHFFRATLAPGEHKPFTPDDPVIEARLWIPHNEIASAFSCYPAIQEAVNALVNQAGSVPIESTIKNPERYVLTRPR
jgi:molybdopterin-guanine dinucleotide biosynthesis protein A/8-oxo-dGTP pyrophosphatase MutT (NUDIX family)